MERAFRILAIDDSADEIELLRLAAEGLPEPIRVDAVIAADEAVAALRRLAGAVDDRPDAVLVDLNMPAIGGNDLLDALRADPALADLPVLVWTTSARPGELERARELGAVESLIKPGRLQDYPAFLARLREVVDRFAEQERGGEAR